jgi:ubiquinone/menaquinone biosynthesis C-methylase UbiE
MAQGDQYLLGYRQAEQERLQRQAQELAHEARWLLDQIGVGAGARVVEIGCGPQGCLDLLSERVGPTGSVVGVERSEDAANLARRFAVDHKLTNVQVLNGDARASGLPRGTFDLATARLVLVNVPQPEEVVAEMVALARPGGTVAFHEADWICHVSDPPLPAWDRLFEIFITYSMMNGIDLFVGRKVPRMLREAGLVDIRVNPLIHVYPPGHGRRTIFLEFVENLRDRLLDQKLIEDAELQVLLKDLKRHLDDPRTLVPSALFFQAWGRKPEQ